MSWCTVAEIGGAATIRHVKIAASVWESYVGRYALFAPSSSWLVFRAPWEHPSGIEWTVDLNFVCSSVSEIKIWRHNMLQSTISTVEVDWRIASFDAPVGLLDAHGYDFEITGVRGTATLQDLDTTDELVAGQSVLRSGAVVLIEEDENALADDQLIVPPAILNSAAITVGRRVIQMEMDQTSAFDDSDYGIGNRLVDGWIGPVQEFLK